MSSSFLSKLDALIEAHKKQSGSEQSEERLVRSIVEVFSLVARELVAEVRAQQAPPRSQAMIRYRPDWDRGGRGQAMIRYRPDWDRGTRSQAMIRYRPDWDRAARTATDPDPDQAASNLLEPMLKELASRLGPDKAAEAIKKAVSSAGLAPEPGTGSDAPKPSSSSENKG